jgi:RND family efflux transporter MFP subunit
MVNVPENNSPVPPAGRSVKLSHVAVLVVVVVAACLFAGLVPRWRQRAALKAETLEMAPLTVTVVSPLPGQASAGLPLPGEIKPLLEAPIYARASGYLKRRLVDIGAKVVEGQLLAVIDMPELGQELAQSRAQLAQAEAALALAKITAARWADLVKTDSVSAQDAAEKQSDFTLKAATVEAARANVHRLEDLQSFTQVTAPFAGTITARGTDVGQLITAGSGKELFHLAQTRTLRVYVRAPQNIARAVVPGQMAELMIPEIPDRVFPAKVVRTAGTVDAQSRTLLAELEVDNAGGEILAGSYAQVRFPEAKIARALTLPANALLFRAEGAQVGVVLPDGKVELRSVTLGRDFGLLVEVLSGVSPSDRVITNPSDSLVSGLVVRMAEDSKPAPTK